jgi:hypothetical protein
VRINVYSQELTSEVMLVTKTGTDDEGKTVTFTGVRLMLASPDALHHAPEDDDRSAITLWLPRSYHRKQELADALYEMASLVNQEM